MSIAEDLVVALDYGQFYLHTAENDPDLAVDLVGDALDDGIAQRNGLVVVVSPHQNNFEMALRVEVWDAEPVSDVDAWEEAFEVHLRVDDYGVHYESPTMDWVTLPVPIGEYRVLIAGRGFVAHGWPGSTTPGDAWRLRLWPSEESITPRRLRAYEPPRIQHPKRHFDDVGVLAVHRIHRMLDDRSEWSGQRATAQAERTFPGSRRKLYPKFRDPSGWLTSTSGGAGPEGSFTMGGFRDPDDPEWGAADAICPSDGQIVCMPLDAQPPNFSVVTWAWTHGYEPNSAELIPTPRMTLRFDLETRPPIEEVPMTLVRVTHDNVPVEMVDDLEQYWNRILERGDYDFDLSDARSKGYRS